MNSCMLFSYSNQSVRLYYHVVDSNNELFIMYISYFEEQLLTRCIKIQMQHFRKKKKKMEA